ncbi:hypothetical protein D3P06_06025 [Paracoccus aestuarii]|uniref:Uncharacterized protein n=1 Tax=Paracoccus aestuarii TaxID=453842 RepID=A0A418ZYS3_9RHOB|nr:hypothetical protein [Paracoccus aestuarii]RJL05681.1 hypothetical protein D3P06_06025 [Paracoccus aestuarii]WCQ98480.1 hypothetical protein JHW48_11230 [Paracoccus aestuarii]
MSDITASERRLSAALDRLDQLLDRPAPQPDHAPGLDNLQARLDAATEQAARLSAANEDLIAANRDLLEAQQTGGIGPDEARAALEAELSALRAARAAEMTQMSEIMAELERLLAEDPPAIDAEPDAAMAQELQGDAGGLPDDGDTPRTEER